MNKQSFSSNKIKILITGHKGLLGSTFLKLNFNWNIVTVKGDISKKDTWDRLHKKVRSVDVVIHAAAKTNVDFCEENRKAAYRTNVIGTQNALDFARSSRAIFVYISTSSIFSGNGNYKESDLPYPKTYYDLTKYLGENISLEYEKGLIIRTNIIGIHPKGSRGKNFAEFLIDSFVKNNSIKLYTDIFTNPVSNWTVAEMIAKIINRPIKARIIHLGSSDTLSKAEIAKLFISKFKKYSGSINYVTYKSEFVDRPKSIWLNTQCAQEQLGIKMPRIREEVKKILNNYSNGKKS